MLKRFMYYNFCRSFSKSIIFRNVEKAKSNEIETSVPPSSVPRSENNVDKCPSRYFTPNKYDKIVLVWSGKYKSEDQIPHIISFDTLMNAQSRLRIRISNLLILLAIALSLYYVSIGKKRRSQGDSIAKMVLQRRQEVIDESKRAKT